MTLANDMTTCCICKKYIDVQKTPDGEILWRFGHNPAPVMDGPNDRCCSHCNSTVVVPKRLSNLFDKSVEIVAQIVDDKVCEHLDYESTLDGGRCNDCGLVLTEEGTQ